jgi:tetratricopeptide (TPR) repeat protein
VQQRRENAEAVATLHEAIVRQQRIGPEDGAMASLLVDLALAYHRQGDAERFGSTVADALDRLSRLPPEQSTASHDSLHELIALLRYAGDWDHLDVAHRRLIEIERVADGPRSAAVAIAYASWAEAKQRSGHTTLADAREPSGDTQAADSLLSLARAIVRDIDEQSPETADAMAQVAAALRNRGALEQADTLYRAAIAMYGDLLGDDHRTVALLRMNLAATLLRRGMPMDAIPLLEGTIATLRQDAESAEILAVSEWRLATALRETGRIAESLAQFQTALQQFEQRFPPDYILTANLRREYGSTLIDAGRFDRAEPMLRRAIRILGGRWGEADLRVDEARIELGRALTGLGRHAEAETMLATALERLEQNPGPDDPLTRRARQAHEALQRSRSRSEG